MKIMANGENNVNIENNGNNGGLSAYQRGSGEYLAAGWRPKAGSVAVSANENYQ